jgi:hypothetical protein
MGINFFCCRRKKHLSPINNKNLQKIESRFISISEKEDKSLENIKELKNQGHITNAQTNLKIFLHNILTFNKSARDDNTKNYLYYFTDENIFFEKYGGVFEFYFIKDFDLVLSQDKSFYIHPFLLDKLSGEDHQNFENKNFVKKNFYLHWSLVVFILIYFYHTKEYLIKDFHEEYINNGISLLRSLDINSKFEICMEEKEIQMIKSLLDPRNDDVEIFSK